MSSYQVANFELRLREAVRRLSRKEQYDDVRLMWRTVHISNAEFSGMVADRKHYFASLRSQLNYPSMIQSMVEFLVVFRFAPFIMGLLIGAFVLRFYIYRRDTFRVGQWRRGFVKDRS